MATQAKAVNTVGPRERVGHATLSAAARSEQEIERAYLTVLADAFEALAVGLLVLCREQQPGQAGAFRLFAHNPTASKLLNVDLCTLTETIPDNTWPPNLLRLLSKTQEVVSGDAPDGWRKFSIRPEGDRATALCVTAFPLPNSHVGITLELDTHTRAEEMVVQQAKILDLANDAIVVQDIRQTILYWNRGAERMYGWTRKEATGKNARVLLQTVFPQPFESVLHELLREGDWKGELIQTRKDGARITVLGHCTLHRDERGDPASVLDINCDITEQKRAEAAVRSLLGISQTLNATLAIDQLLDALVREAIRLVDAESGYSGLYRSDDAYCPEHYFHGADVVSLECSGSRPRGLPEWIFHHRRPYRTCRAESDPNVAFDLRQRFAVRSALGLPIFDMNGSLLGFFEIHNKKDAGGFSAFDEQNLVAVAGIASVAVQNALAYGKLKKSEEEVRQLSGRLLHLQDEERRRIARQLHDTTVQELGAVKMNLAVVSQCSSKLDRGARTFVTESLAMVRECMEQLRTLCYVLHPPLLDESGLEVALPWFVRGFTERSGIKVEVTISPPLGRMSQEVETTLFRIVQEALSNIHNHSGSARAWIVLERRSGAVHLEVRDAGRGIPVEMPRQATPPGITLGVGVAGMRERVKQLGGTLEIESGKQGTTIRVSLPLGDFPS